MAHTKKVIGVFSEEVEGMDCFSGNLFEFSKISVIMEKQELYSKYTCIVSIVT